MNAPNQLMPERRRRPRVVTLKNAGYLTAVVAVIFIAVSVISELRDTTSGRYGRLYGKEIAKTASPLEAPEVIPEEPPTIPESTHADPTLVDANIRQQYLGVDASTAAVQATATPVTTIAAPPSASSDLAITGGSEGLVVSTRTPERPVLSGGFGKPAAQ